ncbi:N-acetylneuraminate synthase family protein [Planctomycetota bacterium]|nr:N-acetylneuraminate synthase family protein [Planctomycetota bacterium]
MLTDEGTNLPSQHTIGHDQPCVIVAALNDVHDVEAVLELCNTASDAGVDIIKVRASVNAHEGLVATDLKRVMAHCESINFAVAGSPQDLESLRVLVEVGVDAIKLGSGQITNRPLIEAVARTGLTTLLSTGGSELNEVTRAVGWFQLGFRGGEIGIANSRVRTSSGDRLVLLHSVLGEGLDPEQANLRAMEKMRSQTFVPVGFSDHTVGTEAASLAVAAGACVLEKSFESGDEFQKFVQQIRRAEVILGETKKTCLDFETSPRQAARRAVVVASSLNAGHVLTRQDLRVSKPGPLENGYKPWHLDELVGRELGVDAKAGAALTREMLKGNDYEEPRWHVPRPPKQKPN